MGRLLAVVLAVAAALAGCKNSPAAKEEATRTYSATATVGDFLLIEIHPETSTMVIENRTTGEKRTAGYTVAADGGYTVDDPLGQIGLVHELPGFALVGRGERMGPGHDQQALVVALLRAPFARRDLLGASYSVLQFRTSEGGIEVGHVGIDASGTASANMYLPGVALRSPGVPGAGFRNEVAFPASLFVDDPVLQCVEVRVPGEPPSRLFGSPSGAFAIDNPNGSLYGFRAPASKAFDAANAGAYRAIVYSKTGAAMQGGVETGAVSMTTVPVVISPAGRIRVGTDEGALEGTLTAVADDPEFHGPGRVEDPCHGLFEFADAGGTKIYVVFAEGGMAFGRFKALSQSPVTYEYDFGFAVRRLDEPGLGFPYADATALAESHCFGIDPWNQRGVTREVHGGIDLAVGRNPIPAVLQRHGVLAPANGTVAFRVDDASGFGLATSTVVLQMNDFWYTILTFEPQSSDPAVALEQRQAIAVSPGQAVRKGDLVGHLVVGSVWADAYPHVHYGLLYKSPSDVLSADTAKTVHNDALRSDGTGLGGISPWSPRNLGIPTTLFCPYEFSSPAARAAMESAPAIADQPCTCLCAYGSAGGGCGVCAP